MSEDILNKTISIGFGENARAFKWKTVTSTVGQFIDYIKEHDQRKEKDGPSILQGTVISSKMRKVSDRKATAVDQLSLVILDIDTGDNIDRIEKKCKELGLFAIIHTTYSNNGTTTKVKRDKILSWAKSDTDLAEEQIIQYMREVKRINPAILKTMVVKGTMQDNDGIQLVIEHAPMPKLRVIFVLDKPFVIAERGGSQKKAIEEWKQVYIGVARQINATVDRACVDPSRLMYLPSCPPDRTDFEFRVVDGSPLDIEEIPRISLSGEEADNAWIEEGLDDHKEYQTPGILKFVATYADHFDAVEMCRDLFDVRKDDGQKVSVICPNDDAHSNAGDPDDVGFFAAINDSGNFVLKCMHDSCAHLDRVDMLDLICTEHQYTVDDLMPWVAEIVGADDVPEERDEPFTSAEDVIRWLKDETTSIDDGRIDDFTKAVAATKPNPLQLDEIASLTYKKTKGARASVIKKTIADHQKQLEFKEDKKENSDDLHEFPPPVMERLEAEAKIYSVVLVNGSLCVLKLNTNRRTNQFNPYEMMSIDTYKNLRCNDNINMIYQGAPKKYNTGKCFLEWEGRKTFDDGLVFEPPPNRPYGRVFNHWNGFVMQPEEGDWSVIADHIYNVICRGNEEYYQFVLTWIAHIFQHPGEKAGSALVLKGKKGTGKSIIFDVFLNKLLRQYSMTISNSKQIVGQFNAHLFGKLYICLEEAVWAGDKDGEGVLKNLISDEQVSYEFKGMTPFMGTNYSRVVFLSNESWVVPASIDERRYFVLSPSDERINDRAYFNRLRDAVYDPAVQAAFMYDMLYTEIGNFDILRSPPRTEWLEEQITISIHPEDNFFIELVRGHGTRLDYKSESEDQVSLQEDIPSNFDADLLYDHYKRYITGFGGPTIRRARPYPFFERKVRELLLGEFNKNVFGERRVENITVPPVKEIREHLTEMGHPIC